jgi:CPA2 family monovalent cation:H+ antiporter-2
MHTEYDLTAIALVMSIALICGLALNQMRQPAVVGYILAGAALGPTGFRLIDNNEAVSILAELGVLMLLFLIGMELNLKSFRSVYQKAVMTVVLQITVSLAVLMTACLLLGVPTRMGVILGFLVALSSTAVAIKMVEDVGESNSDMGRLTVGILIVQDLAVVPMLLITTSLGEDAVPIHRIVLQVLLATAALVGLTVFLSRKGSIRLPFTRALTRSTDIGTLAIMAVCFTAATLSGVFQLSPALGAFLAGLVIGNSTMRRLAIRTAVPVQSILLVIFFLSIGLLIDLTFIWNNLFTVFGLLLVVAIGKTVLNVGILQLLGEPWAKAFQVGLFLSHIGEFSFVLAAAALAAQTLDGDGYRLAITVIALSLMTSPLWYLTARRFHDMTVGGLHNARGAVRAIYKNEIDAVEIGARLTRDGVRAAANATRKVVKPIVDSAKKRTEARRQDKD